MKAKEHMYGKEENRRYRRIGKYEEKYGSQEKCAAREVFEHSEPICERILRRNLKITLMEVKGMISVTRSTLRSLEKYVAR